MIEQGIYFALGCVVAGLLALGFAPIMWARALRLTRQRLQVQIPVSMQEILADRDQLRAEFAVARRKLEQEMDRVRATKAADMGEMGRRAAEIFALGVTLAAVQKVKQDQDDEIRILQKEATENSAQLGALTVGFHDTHVYFEQRLQNFEALQRQYRALEGTAEERRATIAGLNTRAMGLEMTIEDATRARATLERQLSAAKEQVQKLTDDHDLLSAQMSAMQAAHERFRAKIEAEVAQGHETIQSLQSDLDTMRQHAAGVSGERDRLAAQARSIQTARDELRRLLEDRTSQAAAAKVALHADLDVTQRRVAALEETGEALRHKVDALSAERDRLAAQALAVERAHDDLHKQLAEQTALAAQTARNDLDAAAARIKMLEADLEAARQAVHDAREREKSAHLQKGLQAEKSRSEGRSVAEQLENILAENAALRGALDGVRQTSAMLNAPPPAGHEQSLPGDAVLRASIHELGLAVARMTLAARDSARHADRVLPFASTAMADDAEASLSS